MTSTKLERSRMRHKVSRTVLKSSEEGRPSSLRQQYASETSEEDLKKVVGSDVIIGKAYNELNQYNWSEEERFTYDQNKKREDDNLSCIMQSRIEGKIEVAKNLLKAGISIDIISQTTSLPQAKIEQLQEEIA
ncbi:hypothetical protein OZD63_03670 [Wolbachia endosymbiont of Drosophila leontia]|uniref:hypothetical protein n=1 Tax=Wolbachia endosymbiont of Drosophila leontia TaxID=3002580 RepID=UPI0023A9C7DA|nr:hypothetical protein [Wolbachia endosymbiont of Drosophila leontia]MDE5067167.1 hypothetical protein [Wolbachia endosymbiont of Drosophila leontia]